MSSRGSSLLLGAAGLAAAGYFVYTYYHDYWSSFLKPQKGPKAAQPPLPEPEPEPQAEPNVLIAPSTPPPAPAPAPTFACTPEPPSAPEVTLDPLDSALQGSHLSLSLSPTERSLLLSLVKAGQSQLFAPWLLLGTKDADKKRMIAHLTSLDLSYPGGIQAYIANAKALLQASKEGKNPFEGYTPKVPPGTKLDFASEEFLQLEKSGLQASFKSAFVLVAGGLGERLGYSGIKVALPSECASETSFLELYIKHILALQSLSPSPIVLPLAIMTSDDTHSRTLDLLTKNNFFGAAEGQVTLIKQEKVPCLTDNEAHLALDPSDPYQVQTKPHGHGDVHSLLCSKGLVKTWAKQGIEWVCFFQDTNALVFRALMAALGVSKVNGYDMNSLSVPRKAKEAIGAIALLEHKDGSSLTINVEYNQLDPLLRATVSPQGDVNDASGWSPFPGNINQLVIKLDSYAKELEKTKGVISEFVNPKYKDASKTTFKSSTRLECMMQDYPKALPQGSKVGFTTINQGWASYSPVKNSPADAAAKAKEGNPTHSATAGEFDIYKCNSLMLGMLAGVSLPPTLAKTFNSIDVDAYPRVVLSSSFAPLLSDVKTKVSPGSIHFGSSDCTLILNGSDITVQGPVSLSPGSTLVVRACPGAKVVLKRVDVSNAGWEWRPLVECEGVAEEDMIRGFRVVKKEARELVFDKPGDYIVDDTAKETVKEEPAVAPPAPAPAPAPAPLTPAATVDEKEEEGDDDGNESSDAVSKPGLSKSAKKKAKKKKSAAAKAQQ